MINEFVYCPRLFWLEYVDRSFAESHDTLDGSRVHRLVDRPSEKPAPEPGGEAPATRSLSLSSELLGITGIVDVVEYIDGEARPVDYKRGRVPNVPGGAYEPERVQLCLQGLLLRGAGFRSDHGELYFAQSRKRVEIAFDEDLVRRSLAAVAEARAATDGPIPPPLVDSPKCARCSLVGICLPDETAVLQERTRPEDVRPFIVPLDDCLPLYVQTPGTHVGKSGDVIELRRDGAVVDEIRMMDVSHVSLFGNVQISSQTIRELLRREIPVFYFSFGTWLSGMTIPPLGHSIDARIAQFRVAADGNSSLPVAREFVLGKLRNQRTMVRRALKEDARNELKYLGFLIGQVPKVGSPEELLGIEGYGARTYFAAFSRMLKKPLGFTFEGRNRRPPRDPVNATLSFLYALLVRDCVAALLSVGLEPGLGMYHKVRLGRPSLALDLAEEFRPILADSVALSSFNVGELGEEAFVERGIGMSLTESGRRTLIRSYERRLAQDVVHPIFGYALSYRRVLAIQARLLARFLQGDIPSYVAFITR
jgi:CRISPR-associated protein Cas1